MIRYIIRRVLYAIPIAFGVSVVCFSLVYIAPGDPLQHHAVRVGQVEPAAVRRQDQHRRPLLHHDDQAVRPGSGDLHAADLRDLLDPRLHLIPIGLRHVEAQAEDKEELLQIEAHIAEARIAA